MAGSPKVVQAPVERSPLAAKMIEVLGAEQATRRFVSHIATSPHHILTYEYEGPAGKLLYVRSGGEAGIHWGDDQHAYFAVVDGRWVEANE